jgi:neurofibromin 1
MLSIYAKWKGSGYLKATLQKPVERLMMTAAKDAHLELDPTRVNTPDELANNAENLQIVTQFFVDDICASATNIPVSFRKICSIVGIVWIPGPDHNKGQLTNPPTPFRFLRQFCHGLRNQGTRLSVPLFSCASFARRLLPLRLKGWWPRRRPRICAED